MRHLLASLICLTSLWVASCSSPGRAPKNAPLILVSIDGFRWDYLEKYAAPNLSLLAQEGVRARRMTPSFPSKTFPNHYTLVTGLYPEHHGIVSNYFYDPSLQASFNKNLPADNADSRWWQQGEPVWITAEKQGVRTGVYFWPGSEAVLQGLRPSLRRGFDARTLSGRRVDDVLAWLALPADQRPRFIALYLNLVDVVGHKSGPDSPEMAASVKEVDEAIGRLVTGLEKLGLHDQANLIIVSDHGMAEQSLDRVAYLEDLLDPTKVQIESTGPNGGVRPLPGTATAAELAASMRAKSPPQVKIYLREEMPERFHYRSNPRIPPVVFVADEHWNVEPRSVISKYQGQLERGNHGWDPTLSSMGALFVARGPAFRHGVTFDDVENIHLYNLLCRTLGIEPAANDGDDRLIKTVLAR